MNLLLFTYTLDKNHPILSHQLALVNGISHYFTNVTVITGSVGEYQVSSNVSVVNSNWSGNHKVISVLRFIYYFFREIFNKNNLVIYSHMTTIQSLIVAPITFLLGIPHYLWYAHKSKPISLSLAYPLIDGILSSTSGSCPLEKPKVYLIGQGIDSKLFRVEITDNDKCIDLVHFGRIDESKGLIEIIELVKSKRSELNPYTLTLIGNPARNESQSYFDKLTKLSKDSSYREWLTIEPAIARGELTKKLKNFQVFIHNFNGSLDKTLLEATLCNLHIITSNREFIREFGKWDRKNQDSSLLLEFEAFFKLSSDERNKIKRNRVSYVLNNHSFDQWIKKTANILKSNRGN